jgi:hypothetical protein
MKIVPTQIESDGPGIDLSNLADGLSIRMADPVEDFKYARNAVTLTCDLSGLSQVRLAFEAMEFGDEPHAPPPNPFTGDANFDGVAISEDGVTWYEIQDLRHLRSDRFTAYDIDLDAAVAQWGLSYNSAFQIRFCQYDNNPAPMDGIFLHKIELTGEQSAVGVPVFHLPMDDNAANPTVRDTAEDGRDQVFLDPSGDPNTAAHSVPGPNGASALAFDGVDDRIVVDLQTGLGDCLAAGCDFTLVFRWKAPQTEFTELYDYVFTGPFYFNHVQNGSGGTVNAIRFSCRRPVDDTYLEQTYNNANDDLWHHYAVVREGTTLSLWRDGVSGFSDTHANCAGSFTTGQMILVGNEYGNTAAGAMADLRLYDRALSEEEVQALSQGGA